MSHFVTNFHLIFTCFRYCRSYCMLANGECYFYYRYRFYLVTHETHASAVLAVVILSVRLCLSVNACFVTKPNNSLRVF